MTDIQSHERVLVAYDDGRFDYTHIELIQRLLPFVGGVKLGLESKESLASIQRHTVAHRMALLVETSGKKVMWDAKFDDIPNTVGAAVRSAVTFVQPWGITVMAGAGRASVEAAVANRDVALIIGVTVLTSIEDAECQEMYGRCAQSQVLYFAEKLVECGAQAIVCSPLELDAVRKVIGDKLICITPGIRAKDAPADDQKRSMTAGDAIKAGADYLVIGRPIMRAEDPLAAAKAFAEDIAAEEANRSMI